MLRALIVLQTLVCLISLAVPGLPGWKMFTVVRAPTRPLLDGKGRPIDVARYLPYPSYGYSDPEIIKVAPFICRQDPSLAPFTFGARHLSRECQWLD